MNPPTSARLRQSAIAERKKLERQRDRHLTHKEALRAEVQTIDAAILELETRLDLLNRLIGEPRSSEVAATSPEAESTSPKPPTGSRLLRGQAIRATAVRLLTESGRAGGPIHYREWFDLVGAAGFGVSGKDPEAVFLTQLSRSPVVKRAGRAGMYRIDYDAVERLHRQVSSLEQELDGVPATAGNPADLNRVRNERAQLTGALDQAQRELAEALSSLDGQGTSPRSKKAATG